MMLTKEVLAGALSAAFVLAAQPARAATSPAWNAWHDAAVPETFHVLRYLDLGAKRARAVKAPDDEDSAEAPESPSEKMPNELVVVDSGRSQNTVVGAVFKVYRAAPPQGPGVLAANGPIWIELGRLKAVDVQDAYMIAAIETQKTAMSKAFFPRFPGVMAGDVVVAQRMDIVRKQDLTPTVALEYQEIFQDPKGTPATFELKAAAMEALKEAVRPFMKARLSLLMVEGYTDHNGPASANQVESYQRAMTVRQFLIDDLGFDEKRVVAIGYGESEPADPTMKPGYEMANRRIVFKAIPVPAK